MLIYEHEFWTEKPNDRLAGIDEAGRGPLAGPVVAGAVSMPQALAENLYSNALAKLNDSKQVSEAHRKEFLNILKHTPGIEIGIGIAEPLEIDQLNILKATHVAMGRAVSSLPNGVPVHALVDGLPVKGLPCPSTAIVKGDAKSFLIAAASIVAKVTRDTIMDELHEIYPQYNFKKHKGYPTAEHLAALREHGASVVHRQTFGPVAALRQLTLFD